MPLTCSALRLHPLANQDTYELFYPLTQSPESSSAARFTTTTASSADPLSLTVTSLYRLEPDCRSYNGFDTGGPSPGKIANSFIAHPPPILGWVTKRILGFGSSGYLAPPTLPARGSHRAWVAILATASFRSVIGSHLSVLSRFIGQEMRVS